MTVEFSQADGWRTALQKTFSGRHPCALCLKVQEGWHDQQQQEKKLPWLQTENLPEAICEWRSMSVPALPISPAICGVFGTDFFFDFSTPPPTPPPRA
jgi:hypothetical protein